MHLPRTGLQSSHYPSPISAQIKIKPILHWQRFIPAFEIPLIQYITLTPKSNGELWSCGDYPDLNTTTILDRYNVPRLHDSSVTLRRLICRASHQIPITPEANAIIMPLGLYECKVMPFGLRNAVKTFQLTKIWLPFQIHRRQLDIFKNTWNISCTLELHCNVYTISRYSFRTSERYSKNLLGQLPLLTCGICLPPPNLKHHFPSAKKEKKNAQFPRHREQWRHSKLPGSSSRIHSWDSYWRMQR